MSRNKLPSVFSASVLAFAAANAAGQSAPITVGEATSHRAEMQRAKWQAELSEVQGKARGGSPAQVAKTCDDELKMFGVYGVGRKLYADFGFQGTTTTLSANDNRELGGWYVEDITPTRAITVKKVKGKVVGRCTVYLSTPQSPRAIEAMAGAPAAANVMVPPIAPIGASQPATPAATAPSSQSANTSSPANSK